MVTKTQLEGALKDAMRSSDDLRKRTLRMALTAIKLAEVDARGPLDDDAVLQILFTEVKARREAIADANRADRQDLAAEAEAEIAILQEYLPQPLSQEELEDLARVAIDEIGATSPTEIGKVMGVLMPRMRGRAEGSEVSEVVRRLLRQS